MKKYEIYLPLKYNDGTEVEPEKLKQIRERLVPLPQPDGGKGWKIYLN